MEVRERLVEIGQFSKIKPLHVLCYFENFPTWLLLFDAFECLSVTIHGEVTSTDQLIERCIRSSGCTSELITGIVESIGRDLFLFTHEDVPSASRQYDIILLSGASVFIATILAFKSDIPIAFIIDGVFHGRLRQGRPSGDMRLWDVQWLRLQHKLFGGPTNHSALVGFRYIKVTPEGSILRRTIRDIFSGGIRPKHASGHPTDHVKEDVYTLDDTLKVDNLWTDVYHHTPFYKSGWGKRSLSMAEVCSGFGYPRHLHPYLSKMIFEHLPYQVLLPLFQAVITAVSGKESVTPLGTHHTRDLALSDTTVRSHAIQHNVPVRQQANTNNGKSWLPHLQCWLPHTWTGSTQNRERVAKNDDASVPINLWNDRILVLFPNASALLPLLRILCLARARRNVLKDFCRYLRSQYSHLWPGIAQFHRAERHKQSSPQLGGEVNLVFGFDPTVREQLLEDQRQYSIDEDEQTIKFNNTLKYKNTIEEKYKSKEVGDAILFDIDKGIEAIVKISNGSWWEWNLGSSLLYWRWNTPEVNIARDGMVPFIQGKLPNWKSKRLKNIKQPKYDLITKKLNTIIERNYISYGKVSSWTDVFDVPKGPDDIRLVYNGTSCGLNQAIWAPNFWLPFPRSATRLLDFNYFSGDIDLGEMFHNFPLHNSLQEFSGIDLTAFKANLNLNENDPTSFRWTRTWMGARSSPYSAVRYFYLAEEFARGNHIDQANAMRWDVVILNLPGSKSYNPTKPRVSKWDEILKRIAGEIITFVDDIRAMGATLEQTWQIMRQVNSRLQYLGIQIALRKVNEPKRNPGPWAGAVFETSDTAITKSVTLGKWNKAKRLVDELWNQLNQPNYNTIELSYKELEITRGFLCHLSMTFEIIVPYLKGFHLTLASHLNKRDTEGWKYTDKAWKVYLDHEVAEGHLGAEESERLLSYAPYSYEPPKTILPVLQLKDDVHAIRELLAEEQPPKIFERSTNVQIVRYGFGDASGSGFGSTIETSQGIKYRIGVWGSDDESESSNYKELENVVGTIEEEIKCGNLNNSTLFFFTDNSTVEAALHKGNSSSKRLFLLVLRFRRLQFTSGIHVIVSHVAGKRMIEQGTDGVSRGNLHEGVGTGIDMLSFIPLHLNALERHPPLQKWLLSWMGEETEILQPKDWFTRGHDHQGGHCDSRGFWRIHIQEGVYVWAPPPAAAEVALEELRKALIKRQKSTHIFICPKLLTTEWVKQLHKTADMILSIPAGGDPESWPLSMHEPLTIGFVFPLLHCYPWQRKSTPQMFYMERKLSQLFKGEGYQQFHTEGLSETDIDRLELAWGGLQKQKIEFTHAREGDHLLIPFECDFCIFRKLRNKLHPDSVLSKDNLLMACIRRINLDAFWSRASSTVLGNRDRAKLSLRLSEMVGLKGPFEHTTSLPSFDHCGYEVAIQMVLDSTSPGRYSQDHKQWDTIRKLRTVYSNQAKASPQANITTLAFGDERGKAQRLLQDNCSSYWFSRFFIGCKRRMGQDWRPNKAFDIKLLLDLIASTKIKIQEAQSLQDKHNWITFGTYLVVTYVMSLRGVEGLLLDIKGLVDHLDKGDGSYFIIALLGKTKGEHHHRCHLLPCVVTTSSGIPVKEWVDLLLQQAALLGYQSGPAIADINGNVRSCAQLDAQLIELLEETYDERPQLFPPSITNKEDIASGYSVFRSPRRSSDTRAIEKNVSHTDIALFNRWSVVERAQGNRASFPMYQHYAQVELLIEPFKRYTWAM